MRHLTRHLSTLCSAVSLALCVALCVLSVWPHAAGRSVRLNKGAYTAGEYETRIDLGGGGRFVLDVAPYPVGHLLPVITTARPRSPDSLNSLFPPNSGFTFGSTARVVLPSERRAFPGVRWVDYVVSGTAQVTSREFTVACWLPALTFAVLPTVWLVRHRRRARRLRAGLCSACGYDLRASPERCPECGAVPKVTT